MKFHCALGELNVSDATTAPTIPQIRSFGLVGVPDAATAVPEPVTAVTPSTPIALGIQYVAVQYSGAAELWPQLYVPVVPAARPAVTGAVAMNMAPPLAGRT